MPRSCTTEATPGLIRWIAAKVAADKGIPEDGKSVVKLRRVLQDAAERCGRVRLGWDGVRLTFVPDGHALAMARMRQMPRIDHLFDRCDETGLLGLIVPAAAEELQGQGLGLLTEPRNTQEPKTHMTVLTEERVAELARRRHGDDQNRQDDLRFVLDRYRKLEGGRPRTRFHRGPNRVVVELDPSLLSQALRGCDKAAYRGFSQMSATSGSSALGFDAGPEDFRDWDPPAMLDQSVSALSALEAIRPGATMLARYLTLAEDDQQDVRELIGWLEHPDAEEREAAAEALCEILDDRREPRGMSLMLLLPGEGRRPSTALKDWMRFVAERLEEGMARNRVGVQELARRTEIPEDYLRRLLRAETSPSGRALEELVGALDLAEDWFVPEPA